MLKDLETHSITVFRLGKKEQFDPRLRVIEFDMIDDHQPMYASADIGATTIQMHRQRVEVKTIGLDGIHYKYALDPELQLLMDELMELENRELHSKISNLHAKLAFEKSRTFFDKLKEAIWHVKATIKRRL